MTKWEYARLEYKSTGTFGADRQLDWSAIFYHVDGAERWGVDERFNDLPHLNRTGEAGWEVYDRSTTVIGQPLRLQAVTYSLRRPLP